jgi:lipid-A-disaccharide synthase
MKRKQIMLIAGEPSGDMLAAELVGALRAELIAAEMAYPPDPQPLQTALEPRFFGAGGPRMEAAGVELAFDMARHSVIGLSDALKNYFKFRRLFDQLYRLALDRKPDAIVCVDFSGFNRRFAHVVRQHARRRQDWFHNWQPKIVQYVSPQVWASREGRAYQVARDYDLLLCIFPFEQEWYAKRLPHFRVEYVGHPIADRFAIDDLRSTRASAKTSSTENREPQILLLPGSRPNELKRHLPVMRAALDLLRSSYPRLRAQMVLPDEALAQQAKSLNLPADVKIRSGGLPEALAEADIAIASTGTVTMECAFFGVPSVTLYKTSWFNYLLAKQIARVKWLTMPNLLANEEVFPEFIQSAATRENISRAALELLRDESRPTKVKARLSQVVDTLGGPGANRRAARTIVQLLEHRTSPASGVS